MGRSKALRVPPRWVPTLVVLLVIVVLLGPEHRSARADVEAAALAAGWVLFLGPIWCLARQQNGRLCTNRAFGLMGSCGKHRFGHVPFLGGQAGDPPARLRTRNSGAVRVEVVRDMFDFLMMLLAAVGTFAVVLALIR
jgi:hypothetical protein